MNNKIYKRQVNIKCFCCCCVFNKTSIDIGEFKLNLIEYNKLQE